jgi:hypothetical protein
MLAILPVMRQVAARATCHDTGVVCLDALKLPMPTSPAVDTCVIGVDVDAGCYRGKEKRSGGAGWGWFLPRNVARTSPTRGRWRRQETRSLNVCIVALMALALMAGVILRIWALTALGGG